MKQKKKKAVNNKFNFDDDYIIGFSDSENEKGKMQIKTESSKKKVSKKNKKKKAPTKMKTSVIKTFFIIMLFVGAGCFLCLSPTFNIKEIEVSNNKDLSADTVISLSKIKRYENIFTTNKSGAIKKICENPYIDSVKIERKLPNKILISVVEREEKYKVEFAEGKYVIIDGQGFALRVTSDKVELPSIVGLKTDMTKFVEIKNNEARIDSSDLKRIEVVTNIMSTAENNDVGKFISSFDVTNLNDVKLDLASENKKVYLGSCSYLDTRILYMKVILEREKGNKGEILINGDLSEDRVFFRETVK